MDEVRNHLTELKEKIIKGERVEISPRELMAHFSAHRRGAKVVYTIRHTLNSMGLTTEPDFEHAYVDAKVRLLHAGEQGTGNGSERAASANGNSLPRIVKGGSVPDPVPRIGTLAAANRKPVTIERDKEVVEAVTLMLLNDYSQLPVIQRERQVDGMISWRSIGSSRVLKGESRFVRDCMEPVEVVNYDRPLLEAIELIARKDLVLVRDSSHFISGIVTTADLSLEFRDLSEPFLLVGEIENHIRRLIDGKFSEEILAKARDPRDSGRKIETVADLTFGEYIRLLEFPENWRKLNLGLSGPLFVERLNYIREIRNDVMHFHADALESSDLGLLRDTVKLLQVLKVDQDVNSRNPQGQSA